MPNFIIIGAMKSATTTLQEQLACQPRIFMSDPKEPNFFSDDDQFARGLDWYRGLFSAAEPGSLLGEASTHYTKLPTYPATISRLKQHVPDPRLIYVMRHPIDRLISHYIHEWSMGVYRCDIETAVERYPELVSYGQYAAQLEPFFKAFGHESVLPVFFDRLTREPQAELERVCHFIGYEELPMWSNNLNPSNLSSERIRRFPLYGAVVESKLATMLRRTLIPCCLRNAIKDSLTMKKRPVLNMPVMRNLENIFDNDLRTLGHWFGRPIDCANFKVVTSTEPLEWVAVND